MSLVDAIAGWQPVVETRTERITAEPAHALAALLDQDLTGFVEGSALPPLWHWLYFLNQLPQGELGIDGHPRHGGFLPPIPHRRRMFAGGRVTVTNPIRVGETATKRSSLDKVAVKEGHQGELLFVTVRHELTVGGAARVVEEADLVYRSDASRGRPAGRPTQGTPPPAPEAPWRLEFNADPVVLFRFSAITHNAHRIHYDQTYAREAEGFPGLVVHGPLLALLLLELPRRFAPHLSVASFGFRARRPVFAGQSVLVHGAPDDGAGWNLRADTSSELGAMTGRVQLR